ncbi:MAG TPA: YmdB family metallophosphoesterase, partial [Candidatus Methylomirabilis sp.]|nr:YmdB family metallophosphoesterase [Candidatus Methylomirabilis sp.]
ITDVGMTGPRHSVIGILPEEAIRRFLTQMPTRFTVATGGAGIFSAVLLDLDEGTGRARAITRLQL